QNAGAVCDEPESESSTFCPTLKAESPICCRRVRSICRLIAGPSILWCTCASTAPGIRWIFLVSSADSRRGGCARAPEDGRPGDQPADGPHAPAADGPLGLQRRPERAALALGLIPDGARVL